MVFQACCRGAIARRDLKLKIGAIVTIQAGFKMVYAKKELEKRKKEVQLIILITACLLRNGCREWAIRNIIFNELFIPLLENSQTWSRKNSKGRRNSTEQSDVCWKSQKRGSKINAGYFQYLSFASITTENCLHGWFIFNSKNWSVLYYTIPNRYLSFSCAAYRLFQWFGHHLFCSMDHFDW